MPMRNIALSLALMALATAAWAQQELPPATDEGPLVIRPAAKPQAAPQPAPAPPASAASASDAPPQPVDGIYSPGPGVVLPRLTDVVRVPYPDDAPPADPPRLCILSLVVGADGVPAQIKVTHSINSVADQYLVESTQKLRFEAGTVAGQPVPVRISLSYRFFVNSNLAIPHVIQQRAFLGNQREFPGNRSAERNYDQPPRPLYSPAAAFSNEARAKKIQGVVIVSVLVTEDGLPTDARVEKSLGYGLDESALDCVSQYRFKPATKDGQPVATRITVEINFKLF
jgi:protein TonB